MEQSPGLTADPTEDPSGREKGGFGVGTAPLNVAVGQEGPQARICRQEMQMNILSWAENCEK